MLTIEKNTNADKALDSENLFPLLVDSVKDYAIFALDTEGRIASWNRGAERMKGYCAAEIIGKHFSIFYPRQDVAGKPDREMEIARREGKYEEVGWRVRKDGSCFWANVVLSPMWDAEGHLRGYAKVTRDITEHKQAQEELQAGRDDLERQIEERTAALKEGEISHRLSAVQDGVEALAFLRREDPYPDTPRPDLILLDLNLPRKDGRETLAAIKQDPELCDIPVVILTTSEAEKDILDSYKLHANCYIKKPVDLEQFIAIIKSIEEFWFTIVKLPPKEGM